MTLDLKIINDDQLKAWMAANPGAKMNTDYVVIDIREPDEYAADHIEGALNFPSSQLSSPPAVPAGMKTAFFHCRSGHRTQVFAHILAQTSVQEGYCLGAGIEQWKRCVGQTVVNPSAPMEIMRQVQIIVGSIILLGIFLSYTVSSIFILLSAVMAGGLIYSGLTGWCGMAIFLRGMPWNQGSCSTMSSCNSSQNSNANKKDNDNHPTSCG